MIFAGFVRNVWVYEYPRTSNLNLSILYFRAYVYHSLICDSPLEVYVSINDDNGDVYSGKCSCVSGKVCGFMLWRIRIKWYILLHKYNILCRLGQPCNHIAALLFFIENIILMIQLCQLRYQRHQSL